MVRVEKAALVISIPSNAPETLLFDLLQDVPHILMALQCLDNDFSDDRLPGSIYTILDLYRSLLPTNEMVVEKMIKNMQDKT